MKYPTLSIRLPIEKNIEFYEKFILQYSLIIVSMNCYEELIDEYVTEEKIMKYFDMFHGMFNDYEDKRDYIHYMSLDADFKQLHESRGLYLDRFYVDLQKKTYTPSKLLKYFNNINQFLLLYSTFEGILKNEYRMKEIINEGKFVRENQLICFSEKYVEKYNCKKKFLSEISERSLMENFDEISCLWNYFTNIRHLYVHSSGIVTEKWLQKIKSSYNKLEDLLERDIVWEIGKELSLEKVKVDTTFYIEDNLLNFFRNYIVAFMESLYCCFID